HDSFKYSSSGLGAGAQLVIAIAIAAYAGPMISNFIGAGTSAGSAFAAAVPATATSPAIAAGWANVALTAAATGATSNAAVSVINNRGDLGAVLKDVTSSDNLKGYATSALTAGFTTGVLDGAFGVTGDNVNKVTKGFDLSKTSDLVNFGSYLGAQGAVQAVAQTAVQGGSLGDNLRNALTKQVQHLLQAVAFNAAGDLALGNTWEEGSPEKITLHALVGGLLSEATGGDFKTGALAAGVNEALLKQLTNVIDGDRSLELAVSQLVGVAAATATGGDPAKAAELAKNATAYNRQLHEREEKWLRENAKRFADDQGISEQEALERLSQQALKDVDYLWRGLLSDGDDNIAKSFLADSGQTFTNDLGGQQALFTASGHQLFRPEMFADTADTQFYRDFVQSGISRELSAGVLKELKDSGVSLKNDAVELGKLIVNEPGMVLDGLWEGIKGLPQGVVDSLHESGNAIGEGSATALNEDISSKLNAIYGMDVSTAQETMLLVRTVTAVVSAGTVGAAGKATANLSGELADAVGKKLDNVLNGLAEQALVKSGGIHGADGKPLLDLKQLTNKQKGVMGELFGENTVKQIISDGEKLARMPGVGETGIDDLYKVNRPDVDYVVIEYKFVGTDSKTGASVLGKPNDGVQGSESWTLGSGRLEKAVEDRALAADIADSIQSGRTETWVVTTRVDGATELQILDGLGKPKPIDTSKILTSKMSLSGSQP
ncbi:DUF637 domain-containing protein, partial [Pseudomonas sp. 21C1]